MHCNKEQELAALKAAAEAARQAGHPIINRFDGRYHFLSNFYEVPVTYNGITYRNTEAAFQAQKCLERAHEFADISANEAKRLGRKVTLRPDWNDVRIDIMHNIVLAKFRQNTDLYEQLIATGDCELIEGNYWGDRFWGVCSGTGENHLGQILMQVREELKDTLTQVADNLV